MFMLNFEDSFVCGFFYRIFVFVMYCGWFGGGGESGGGEGGGGEGGGCCKGGEVVDVGVGVEVVGSFTALKLSGRFFWRLVRNLMIGFFMILFLILMFLCVNVFNISVDVDFNIFIVCCFVLYVSFFSRVSVVVVRVAVFIEIFLCVFVLKFKFVYMFYFLFFFVMYYSVLFCL